MFPRLMTCFVFLKIVSIVVGAPVVTPTNETATEELDCHNETADVYDQRQNGTENYRIHVNGVVVLVAPAEAVLQAAQLSSLQEGVQSEGGVASTLETKPKPKPSLSVTDKVPLEEATSPGSTGHPKEYRDKPNMKLFNLLHMFRSIKHDTEGLTLHPTS